MRNIPSASLEAQRREASLLRAAGRGPAPPLKDPSPWLGRGWAALLLRWRAGQTVRAALFADPRTAIYAALEKARAAALGVLHSGSAACPPSASDR